MADDDVPTAPFRDTPGGGAALLVIDMINLMEFGEVERMTPAIAQAAAMIARLRDEADRAKVPTIYVNDNFGEWHSEKTRLVDRACAAGGIARDAAERLRPRDQDFFVIKPQFSGFYATNLPVLLPKLGVTRLILTGIAADICVLFTAGDAHMRDYRLWAPEDAVAAASDARKEWALEIMRLSMGAETAASADLPLQDWLVESAGD